MPCEVDWEPGMTSIRQGNQSDGSCLVKVGTIGTWAKEAAGKTGRSIRMEVKLIDRITVSAHNGTKSRTMQLLQREFPNSLPWAQRGRLEEKSTWKKKKQENVFDMLTLRWHLASPVEMAVGCVNLRMREGAWGWVAWWGNAFLVGMWKVLGMFPSRGSEERLD